MITEKSLGHWVEGKDNFVFSVDSTAPEVFETAKRMAIDFATWLDAQRYTQLEEGLWFGIRTRKTYTVQELFNLYLNQQIQ